MFLYFAPKTTSTQPPAAIAYAFERPPVCREVIANGPDGGQGMLYGERAESLGFNRNTQKWQKIPGTDCWCGWSTDQELPTPEALIRREALAGHAVELGGGRPWLVPVARSVSPDSPELRWVVRLPQQLELGDDGQWYYGPIVKRYQRLWEIATTWYDQVLRGRLGGGDDIEVEISVADAINLACETLQANYRVGPVELSAMGVWESGLFGVVLDALCDLQTLVEWLQARAEATPDPANPEKKSGD